MDVLSTVVLIMIRTQEYMDWSILILMIVGTRCYFLCTDYESL